MSKGEERTTQALAVCVIVVKAMGVFRAFSLAYDGVSSGHLQLE